MVLLLPSEMFLGPTHPRNVDRPRISSYRSKH